MAAPIDSLRITLDFTVRLCTLLRQSGVTVSVQQTIACMRSIRLFGTFKEEELKRIYRTTLINRKQDIPLLERAYDILMQDFLRPPSTDAKSADERGRKPIIVRTHEYAGVSAPSEEKEEHARTEGYSVREVDRLKDFRLVDARRLPQYMSELEKISRHYATLTRRKTRTARRGGRIDIHASLRESVRSGGEIMKLRFKRKLPTHSRFVVVCDVSGSMEIYAVFLLNFLHHLHRLKQMQVESFVFSTYLQSLTRQFRSRNFPEMLRNVAAHFTGWSGGTRIGAALQSLNETYATSVTPKTTVVVMSDGWDTGEIPLLEQEMARLKRRARAVIWINPLKGAAEYEPLAAGMAAARPYCDHFIPGHNIESFVEFARLVRA